MERFERKGCLAAAAIIALASVLGSGCASTGAVPDAEHAKKPARATGGSVATIPSEVIQNSSVDHVEELLDRVPGVWVMRVPNGFSVRIRGASSMFGSNEPLYVVDGVPLVSLSGGTTLGIYPRNVESISILRGASAALYGSRGGNGVVVIKTKRTP